MGEELELVEAMATMSLQPPHNFTPWLVINGEPAGDNYPSVTTLICDAYQGTKPAACSDLKTQPRGAVCSREASSDTAKTNHTVLYKKCAIVKVLGNVCLALVRHLPLPLCATN